MKTNASRHPIQARLLTVAVLLICGFAAAANAQSSGHPAVAIRFTLPFQAHWGTRILPAGQYTMYFDNSHPAALVQSANGKTAFYTPIPIRNRSNNGPAALLVVVRGNERMVRSLNLPKSDLSLVYQPATNTEREILAQADQIKAVPLITADK